MASTLPKRRLIRSLLLPRSPFPSNRRPKAPRLPIQSHPYHTTSPHRTVAPINTDGSRNRSTSTDYKSLILQKSLSHVHSSGWTDESLASGTLDAGLPPSYIGRIDASALGSADLVSFFMERSNAELESELIRLRKEEAAAGSADGDTAARLYRALKLRLSKATPFVASKRWHEAVAVGALPRNWTRTAGQLEEISRIALDYASSRGSGGRGGRGAARRAAVAGAYVAAELHLVSEGASGGSGGPVSLGERYRETWTFLRERCEEAARVPDDSAWTIFDPSRAAAAAAAASSLFGGALSLAAPAAAAAAGAALPRVAEALGPLRDCVSGRKRRDGTRPSDYEAEDLPPFEEGEVIFPEVGRKTG